MHRFAWLLAVSLGSWCVGCGGSGAAVPTRARRVQQIADGPPVVVAGSRPSASAHARSPAASARVGPQVRGTRARRARVPILMYHVIAAAPPGSAYPGLWVAPSLFAAQMNALARAGYHGVTLQTALDAWTRGSRLPARPIVVSFDDGYRSDDTSAAPVLHRLGWPGVLNLELRNAATDNLSERRISHLMSWGWEIDSHTLTHPDLTAVSDAQLRREVRGSRAAIRRRFGQPAAGFCYPAGRFDPRVEDAVRAAGYRAAMSEVPGIATAHDDRYALPRIRVTSGETPGALLRAVGG